MNSKKKFLSDNIGKAAWKRTICYSGLNDSEGLEVVVHAFSPSSIQEAEAGDLCEFEDRLQSYKEKLEKFSFEKQTKKSSEEVKASSRTSRAVTQRNCHGGGGRGRRISN